MAPVPAKRTWKEVNSERKTIRKKWKEKKLLKQLGVKSDVNSFEEALDKPEEIETKSDATTSNETIEKPEEAPPVTEPRTVSIAVPGSIMENAQSAELRTYLAGQIARAACIYNVDEIVVFDDKGEGNDSKVKILVEKKKSRSCLQLARILQYLECPQYLRKHIFPLHKDLQYAGLLNPLDAPHHLRQQDESPYREGIVSDVPLKAGKGSYVNVGLLRDVVVDKVLTPSLRVTVKFLPQKEGSKKLSGVVVPPSQPKSDLNLYWGYTVRLADSLSEVLTNSPYKEGYDLTIGTSEKGTPVEHVDVDTLNNYKHCLIVFGGLHGLEAALEADEKLTVDDVSLLFDKYLNTCPKQGSRVIRTEEAILISLAELRRVLNI
ncbi:hypothetical protein LSTR_LSTR006316 [Laodelphax striatellus]|uniref:Uncharacterized protein n=2 Tax=Laodelphax striatellus TaxID=195883 RepID=A0A482XQA3_LAOST|nr:hypothetical protein LSTR_LSTR006316 [Laodelphax striatellus]